jgi:vacuolar protein sorting-associated protein 13D
MLESLAAWFLNNYLGKYLENLNTDQLSIALLQGEVELENVPLRRDALRFFNASLDVRAGVVGRIKLKIPVSRLRSEPWHILMERVYIVTGPQRFENFDPDHEEALVQELKLAALDGIEAEWRAEHDKSAAAGEEFTNPCFDSILNRSSNELRNDFPVARPRSKQRNHCLESWYSSIVS